MLTFLDAIYLFANEKLRGNAAVIPRKAIIATGKIGDTVLLMHVLQQYDLSNVVLICDQALVEYIKDKIQVDIVGINRAKILRNLIYRYQVVSKLNRYECALSPGSYRNRYAEGFIERVCGKEVLFNAEPKLDHELDIIDDNLKVLDLKKHYDSVIKHQTNQKHSIETANYIAISPCASDPRRSLDSKALCEYVLKRFGDTFEVYVLGSIDQMDDLKDLEVRFLEKDVRAKAIYTKSINEVEKKIERSSFFIGPDSGLTHIAALMGVQTIVFSAGGHWGKFFPYPKKFINVETIASKNKACFKCNHSCMYPLTDGRFRCVSEAQTVIINME